MYTAPEFTEFTGSVMIGDPSGRGNDETTYCVTKFLNGFVFVRRWPVHRRVLRGDADATPDKPLCPGCYMIALVAAAMTLAKRNGQSLRELGMTMSHYFFRVAEKAAAGEEQALPEEMVIAPFADLGIDPSVIEGEFTVINERLALARAP